MIQPSSKTLQIIAYLYERRGVYYFRLRHRQPNTDRMTSLSLRTQGRCIAMTQSRHIKPALKTIHADNPNASYEDMREHLRDIVEWKLSMGRSDLFEPDMRGIYWDQYGESGEM